MTYLRNSILATIAYYDILNLPLTLIEVHKYLINPGRLSNIPDGLDDISMGMVLDTLDDLIKIGLVGEKNGFYFLIGRDGLCSLRIDKEKISSQKWKKFLGLSKWLVIIPYLRGMFASGSLAISNSEEKSDFDVLIVAKYGRLYTCRLFLWLFTSLQRSRRGRFDRVAPNKFCFNHYITDNNLTLIHESLFNAQTYINLKPVIFNKNFLDRFFSANIWLNNYIYNFRPQYNFIQRSVNKNLLLKSISRAIEIILDTFIGDWLEKIARDYQQRRIKSNPATYESGGRVVFNDRELEFHPQSFEKIVLAKYKENIRKLGITPYIEEQDSGLLK